MIVMLFTNVKYAEIYLEALQTLSPTSASTALNDTVDPKTYSAPTLR